MSIEEVRELGDLYRMVTSDLAIVRRDYPGERTVIYLNQLATRAHSSIYRRERGGLHDLRIYFLRTIPQTFRRTSIFTLVAFLLFLVPAVTSYLLAVNNPDIANTLGLEQQRETLADQQTWTDIPIEERPYASTFITTNNIRVAILAFGGGVSFGLFTVYILIMNGISIGAVMGLAVHYGMGDTLLDFIFAHGVVELSVIFMAGGTGLQMGWAMLNPEPYSRRDALTIAAQRAVALIVISVPLLIGSGLIEGFVSPTELPFTVKMFVGLSYGMLMYVYLLFSGQELTGKSRAGQVAFEVATK